MARNTDGAFINTKTYIEKKLKIKTKNSEIVPFILNAPQMRLYDIIRSKYESGAPIRIIILKARQMGFSTLVGGMFFKDTATSFNTTTAIVAHEDKATQNLFGMYDLFYSELDDALKPKIKRSNAYELNFNDDAGKGLNSRIVCFTAGGKGIGRSFTIKNLHISEYGLWPGDKKKALAGLLSAVPNTPESIVIIESTANGFEQFKEMWDQANAGEIDFVPLFVPWYELSEYRMQPEYGFKLTEGERHLQTLYNLDDEQIVWRRWCLRNNCNNDIKFFQQEYPSNPEEAFISTGESVFNNQVIIEQITRARKIVPIKGYFEYVKKHIDFDNSVIEDSSIHFVEAESGYISIYEQPQVKKQEDFIIAKCPYVIGGDTAGIGEDYYSAKAINNRTKQTAAVLHKQRMDDDLYADQLYCMGRYYHNALIGVEVNFSTQPNRELERLHYHNLYIRERMDTLENRLVKAVGFDTNTKTRPVIISDLVTLMREDPSIEVDVVTLKEMLTFVRKENGKQEAQEGYHDDMVMATAIAHFISSQQSSSWQESTKLEKGFEEKNFKQHKETGGAQLW